MIGGDEPNFPHDTGDSLQNFMEQALTYCYYLKRTCTTSISSRGRYPEQCRDSRSIQYKVVCCRPTAQGFTFPVRQFHSARDALTNLSRKFVSIGLYTRNRLISSARADGHSGTDQGICCVPRIWEKRSISSHLRIYRFRRHPRRPWKQYRRFYRRTSTL